MPRAFEVEVDAVLFNEDDVEIRIRHLKELKEVSVEILYEYDEPVHANAIFKRNMM